MGRFVINVREIDEGVSEYRFDVPVDWLAGMLEDCEGITAAGAAGIVELTATKRGRKVLLEGRMEATLDVTCVRCLEDFAHAVESEVEVLMIPGPGPVSKGKKDDKQDEDDLGVERFQGDLIVVDTLIRDSLILEVPMNPNCGDECPGWDHLRPESSQE